MQSGLVQIWLQSSRSPELQVHWGLKIWTWSESVLAQVSGLVLLGSSQDLSPSWDRSMDPSSSERPVSTVMTKDATEALLAIGCSSPGRGKEDGSRLNLNTRPDKRFIPNKTSVTFGSILQVETNSTAKHKGHEHKQVEQIITCLVRLKRTLSAAAVEAVNRTLVRKFRDVCLRETVNNTIIVALKSQWNNKKTYEPTLHVKIIIYFTINQCWEL